MLRAWFRRSLQEWAIWLAMKSDVDRDFFNIGWTLGRAHAHADLARAVAQAYADGWNARAALVTDTPSNERDAHVVVH